GISNFWTGSGQRVTANLLVLASRPVPVYRPFALMKTRTAWAGTVVCVCLSTALVATWPLLFHPTTAIPLGTEREATVPLFNLWSLWWTADRLAHGFAHYWDAPFFYPNKGVLAYSEPQTLTGLLVAPLWALGAPPALIYNVAFWALLTLNGLFAYRLARALDLPSLPALLGSVLTVTLPFVASLFGVLPFIATFGMLWTLEGLVRFGKDGTIRSAIWGASGFVATYLTCQQYALLFALFAAAAGLVALAQQRFGVNAAGKLIAVSVVMCLVISLWASPALRVHASLGFHRPELIVQALSARPRDFLTRPATALLGYPPRSLADTAGLFPGGVLLGLAVAGTALGIRDPRWRRWATYMSAGAVAAMLLAAGLNLNLAGWRPFATLRLVVPGIDRVRSPFRFVAIGQLFLPILAAMALTRARQYLGPTRSAFVMVFLGLLAAGENLSVPAPQVRIPLTPRTPWTAWLRAQPEDTVVAHVPFPGGLHVSDYEIEAWRMFAQIDHRKPMVNGYSGYFPQARTPDGQTIPTYTRFQLRMAEDFPNDRLLCVLDKALGVNRLVVGREWLTSRESRMDLHRDFLRPIHADREVQVYSLDAPGERCRPGDW
ncbi:MAG: hypothetical protein L0191_15370, partial [Acidobacteria bacterium]|nr:hypothetical protein [Acidobacteriota bacterium]